MIGIDSNIEHQIYMTCIVHQLIYKLLLSTKKFLVSNNSLCFAYEIGLLLLAYSALIHNLNCCEKY